MSLAGTPVRPASLLVLFAVAAAALAFRAPAPLLLASVPLVTIANQESLFGSTTIYPSEVLLLAMIATLASRRPSLFRFSGVRGVALAYGAWMALAALVGALGASETAVGPAVLRLVRTGFLAATLFALGYALGREGTGAMAWIRGSAAAAGVIGLAALAEAVLDRGRGVQAIGSLVGGPELLALHLTLLIPPGLAWIMKRPRQSLVIASFIGISGVALGASFSRSGWLGGWAAILAMGLLGFKIDRRLGTRLLVLALVLIGAAVVGALVLGAVGGDTGRAYADRLGSLGGLGILGDRRADWALGIESIAEHPLFGRLDPRNPYNIVLGLAVASGLPILVPFLWLVFVAMASGAKAPRGGGDRAIEALGLTGAIVALLVTGMGESTLGSRLTPPAFASLGLLAGLGACWSASRRRS